MGLPQHRVLHKVVAMNVVRAKDCCYTIHVADWEIERKTTYLHKVQQRSAENKNNSSLNGTQQQQQQQQQQQHQQQQQKCILHLLTHYMENLFPMSFQIVHSCP